MSSFPGSNPSDSTLWVAVNIVSNNLDGGINDAITTVTVDDASSFPSSGYIVIDTEVIKYSGTTGTSFTGCTRGADGTSAAVHTDGTVVYHNWVADHHNALKDEIIAIATNLTNRIGGHATQVRLLDGAVQSPALVFQNNTDCGLYRIGANNIGFAISGGINTQWNTTGFGILNGTVTNPGLFFNDDANLGIYRVGADNLGISAGGVLAIQIEDPADLSASEVSLRVYVKDDSTLSQVTTGADDSGTAGFKYLRVPN